LYIDKRMDIYIQRTAPALKGIKGFMQRVDIQYKKQKNKQGGFRPGPGQRTRQTRLELFVLNDSQSAHRAVVKLRHVLYFGEPVLKQRLGVLAHLVVVAPVLHALVAFEPPHAPVHGVVCR
jgi:hypothetical protein